MKIKELEKERSKIKVRLAEIEDELALAPNQLEREFRQIVDTVRPQIEEKIEEARKLLQEACKLSEQYGIPFYADGASDISQSYLPNSFKEKYDDLSPELVRDLTDVWPSEKRFGWEHSEIC